MLLAVDPEPPPQATIIKSGAPPVHLARRITEYLATIESTPPEEAKSPNIWRPLNLLRPKKLALVPKP